MWCLIMQRKILYFTAPCEVEFRREPLRKLKPGELLLKTTCSLISSGTELLIYKGEAPSSLAADATLSSLSGSLAYPLAYGYCTVGTVADTGPAVDRSWQGRRVFAFVPHATHHIVDHCQVIPLPDDLPDGLAVLLPTLETAVTLVMDSAPVIGDKINVFGQGIVGLSTTYILSKYPLNEIISYDSIQHRLNLSTRIYPNGSTRLYINNKNHYDRADISIEITGNPDMLNVAINHTAFDGRVVIGSWYGTKHAVLQLGEHFHRSRIRLVSSQVSTIPPMLMGRWDKERRTELVLRILQAGINPLSQLITHVFDFDQAPKAYHLLHNRPEEYVGIAFSYA